MARPGTKKAMMAFFVPGLAILVGPLTAGHPPVASDYWMALGAAISAAIAVYLIPNTPEVEEQH